MNARHFTHRHRGNGEGVSSYACQQTLCITLAPLRMCFSRMLMFLHSDDDDIICSYYKVAFMSIGHAEYGSTLETRFVYTPSDCFETFPFPRNLSGLDDHRRTLLHAPPDHHADAAGRLDRHLQPLSQRPRPRPDIQQLRDLHVEMDYAVAAAYGWQDLALDHGFHDTKQGIRFTVAESARRELLDRLLALNHQRHREEVEAGRAEITMKNETDNG